MLGSVFRKQCMLRLITVMFLVAISQLPSIITVAQGADANDQKITDLQNAIKTTKATLAKATQDRDSAHAIVDGLPSGTPSISSESIEALKKAQEILSDKAKIADNKTIDTLDKQLRIDVDATNANSLAKARTDLQAARDATDGLMPTSDDSKTALADARTESATVLSQADTVLTDIKTIIPDDNTGVTSRVRGVYTFASGLTDHLSKDINNNGIVKLSADAKAADLRPTMAASLTGFISAEKLRLQMADVWPDTSQALKADLTDFNDTEVQLALEKLAKLIKNDDSGVVLRLQGWFDALQKEAADETATAGSATDELNATLNKPRRDSAIIAKATSIRNAANEVLGDLNNITTEAPDLLALWEAKGFKPDLIKAEKSFALLQQNANTLGSQTGVLDGILAGDADHFVQDQVRLFYFTDIPRLLQAINPNAKLITSSTIDAARQRQENANANLVNQEKDIAALSEEINRHQDRVRSLQESIRLARAQLADAQNRQQAAQTRARVLARQQASADNQISRLNAEKSSLTAQNQVLQSQQTDLKTKLTQAQADNANGKNNAKIADLQNQIQQNQNQQDQKTARINAIDLQVASIYKDPVTLKDQQDAATAAQNAVTTIQGQITDLNSQVAQLNPQLAAAKQDLIDVQVRRAAARREAMILAQQETEAFGQARDHQPYWYAPASGLSSNDPTRRVILYGYEDSSTIFIRGLYRDVQQVKEIIGSFDRPAPQARITLYSLQMNGNNAAKFNEALKRIDDTLRDLRGAIILVQDKLRDSVSEEVRESAEVAAIEHCFTSASPDDRERLLRYCYYTPQVSRPLGFDLDIPDTNKNFAAVADVTKWTLPDPSHATTLGEALFTYSLGNYQSRVRILARFIAEIYKEYVVLSHTGGREKQKNNKDFSQFEAVEQFLLVVRPIISINHQIRPEFLPALAGRRHGELCQALHNFVNDSSLDCPSRFDLSSGYPHFFVTILGSVVQQQGHEHELTANQAEILMALQSKARRSTAAQIRYLVREIGYLSPIQRLTDVGNLYREQYVPLVGWLNHSLHPDPTLSAAPWNSQGIALLNRAGGDLIQKDLLAYDVAAQIHRHNDLTQASARVAAADDMIKRMLIVAEDDLDYFFTAPALETLRRKVTSAGVELGTLQRESILATNRLVARVDPHATATLNLPGGTNVLDSALQLGQIAARFRESQRASKLSQTLPIFGAGIDALVERNSGTALAYGGLLSLFGDLAARPQDPPGEIYSITSGNTFKVTPIFDPTGQALRFKFDYVAQTLIQEPDGTTTPDLSRVDRHTVNTEVQLTNLEVREISRFESNAKIGTPAVRTGGLPIINKIPLLRDIPILGYYYYRRAQAATRQESIIFAQTSIYPTVGDLAELFNNVAVPNDLNPETPAYLIASSKGSLDGLILDPMPGIAGSPIVGTVALQGPADQDVTVTIESSDETVAKPAESKVVVPMGQTYATFVLNTTANSSPKTIAITASVGSYKKIVRLTVQPASAPVPKPPKK